MKKCVHFFWGSPFHETHNMRYFSVNEIKKFAERAGFEMISHEINGWNLEVVVRKK